MKVREYIRFFEWHLLLIAFVLTAIGIAFIWSASQGSEYLAKKPLHQALFLCASLPVMAIILRLGYFTFSRWAYFIYGVLLLMLVLVLFMGRGGAARWFDIGFGFRLQPSEFMKLGVIFALSRYLMYRRDLNSWRGIAVPLALAGIPMLLIIKQPDLGTALVLAPILAGMVFVSGYGSRKLIILIVLGMMTMPCAYFLPILKDYQKERINSFLEDIPALSEEALALKKEGKRKDALLIEDRIRRQKRGAGYQQFYAMVAIGSGGFAGAGLTSGPQNRMGSVPERHTDFIFAIVGEEWGLWGCSAVLLLFFLMTGIIFGIANISKEPFGRMLCTGVGLLFITQAFVNTAISVGLLPITGLTLPFVSYGGSSLLSSYCALALVLEVGVRRSRVLGR